MRSTVLSAPRLLDDTTRDILSTAEVGPDGRRLRLAEQLTPAAFEPVGAVLTALGAQWRAAERAFVFPPYSDPAGQIADVLTAGVIPLPPRTGEGFVRTPRGLADDLCDYPYSDLRWLPAGATVLEPSAGDGALVAAIGRINPHVGIVAVEPNQARADRIRDIGARVEVHVGTFEQYAATAIRARTLFDGIVMNPPFALPTDPEPWVEHLRLAWHLLRPGSRLVAVAPAGLAYRGSDSHRAVRQFVEHHGSHASLPPDAFAGSGTMFATRRVQLSKPVRAGGPDHFLQPADGAPVRVDDPVFTGAAAAGTPVQVWWDGWRSRDRILRFHGRCIGCGWLLWGADDGENDPRGILGDFTVGFSLDPHDYDQAGPQVGLCCRCGNDGDLYTAGLTRARTHWSTPAHGTAAAARTPGACDLVTRH
ncbi:hypothetical protein [Dactylosporangium sp. NPDC000521]|uniref:hypothetical protein n=1 Tax=Dactylosporangium sp. NPDC000521 TaxID=3363975 RepID=UPI00369F3B71